MHSRCKLFCIRNGLSLCCSDVRVRLLVQQFRLLKCRYYAAAAQTWRQLSKIKAGTGVRHAAGSHRIRFASAPAALPASPQPQEHWRMASLPSAAAIRYMLFHDRTDDAF